LLFVNLEDTGLVVEEILSDVLWDPNLLHLLQKTLLVNMLLFRFSHVMTWLDNNAILHEGLIYLIDFRLARHQFFIAQTVLLDRQSSEAVVDKTGVNGCHRQASILAVKEDW